MPIYRYKNLHSGEVFEVKQSVSDPPLSQHPESGDPVKRLVSRPAIAFKGSGFYATDSRKPNGEAGAKADSAPKAEGAAAEGAGAAKAAEPKPAEAPASD